MIPYTELRDWLFLRAIRWLSRKLEVDYVLLRDLVKESKQPSNSLYRIITVKRSGKKRKIHIPNGDLMIIQRKINKRILSRFPRSQNSFGFAGGSIENAINIHLGAEAIWTCDIKDAFPSMLQERVFGVFKSHFSPSASHALTLLTTIPLSGALPQGAPTSPRIFDLCMRILDREFSKMAEGIGGRYSRYADNLFFSGEKERLGEIEKEVFSWFQMAELTIHKVRVKDLSSQTAARILGLNIMGKKIHNTRSFKRALRISIHHIGWLLDNGKKDSPEFTKAWRKLQGQMKGFAKVDTLSEKLLRSYSELEKRLG
jgi:RNA-directed DNA polymerase